MTDSRRRLVTAIAWLVPFLLSAAVALELARPFAAAPIAFDAAVSVLHFDRIAAGRHLEAFVSTTPKPLLTVLYGPLMALTDDWRSLTWAAIVAAAAGVALAANLARRIDGDLALVFAAVGLAGAPTLLFDSSLALATPWALLLWAVAGWAVTAERPRYWVAGIALGLASLARLETLVVVGLALVVLAVVRFGPGGIRRPVPRSAWLIALGLLALPVAMVHDLLLTGDPLFWTTVAARYTEATRNQVLTPAGLVATLGRRYLAEPALVILAVVGWLRLIDRRRVALAIGLFGLGPGVASFLLLLAARHVFVSDRYFAAIDLSVAFTAALGVAAVTVEVSEVAGRLVARLGPLRGAVAPTAVAILAIGVTAGWAGIGTDLRTTIRGFLWQAVDAGQAEPALRAAVDAVPGARAWLPSTGTAAGRPLLVVPTPLRPRLAVDLDLPLTQIGSISASTIDVEGGNPGPGQIVFHDRRADGSSPGFAPLEVTAPAPVGSSLVVPVASDPGRGWWVVRIEAG